MVALASLDAEAHLDRLLEDNPAGVLFDGINREALRRTAALIWKRRTKGVSWWVVRALRMVWRCTGARLDCSKWRTIFRIRGRWTG